MVFLADQVLPIPEKDLISWIFDEVPYDQDLPVSTRTFDILVLRIDNLDLTIAERSEDLR